MSLKRFRIEVEGEDQEDVESQLDIFFGHIAAGIEEYGSIPVEFECTDEHVHAITRNGIPLMYGRRVFKVTEKEDDDAMVRV